MQIADCPPHHWICEVVRRDGITYTKMICKKCLDEKEVIFQSAVTKFKWKVTK